jgi:two-component system, NarL family, response regulator LiaR
MLPRKRIRVLIADDHALMRQGVIAFLERCADFELVGEATNGKEAVDLAAKLRPDVILMDLKMPVMDGLAATRVIRRKYQRVKVLALTSFLNADLLMNMLDAGAIGYLLKTIAFPDLAAAIRDAYVGKATLSREAEQILVDTLHRRNTYSLTGREREILSLMVRGMTNAEIAEHLTVSLWTVKKHISNIFAKLETNSRTEAIAIAVRNNLVLDWYVHT